MVPLTRFLLSHVETYQADGQTLLSILAHFNLSTKTQHDVARFVFVHSSRRKIISQDGKAAAFAGG